MYYELWAKRKVGWGLASKICLTKVFTLKHKDHFTEIIWALLFYNLSEREVQILSFKIISTKHGENVEKWTQELNPDHRFEQTCPHFLSQPLHQFPLSPPSIFPLPFLSPPWFSPWNKPDVQVSSILGTINLCDCPPMYSRRKEKVEVKVWRRGKVKLKEEAGWGVSGRSSGKNCLLKEGGGRGRRYQMNDILEDCWPYARSQVCSQKTALSHITIDG